MINKRKVSRAQLFREAKRLIGPETMKDIPDDVVASVRDKLVTGRSVPYDSIGDRFVHVPLK